MTDKLEHHASGITKMGHHYTLVILYQHGWPMEMNNVKRENGHASVQRICNRKHYQWPLML